MSDNIDQLISMWRDSGGLFHNLSALVPFVSINAPPRSSDKFPKCLMAGPESIQAKVANSLDPTTLTETFVLSRPDSGASIVEAHKVALHEFQPLLSTETFYIRGHSEVQFRRLILPTRTPHGARLLMTYSFPIRLH